MKDSNNRLFLGLSVLLGGVGAALRWAVMHTAIDEKGLLIPTHPANLGMWGLSILFTVAVWLLLKKRLGDNGTFADSFPGCPIRFGLCMAAGALLAFESFLQLRFGIYVTGGLGMLAALSMMVGGWFRWKGTKPLPLFHILVCGFFIARLVISFRSWSADPQFQDFAMQMLACVSLMLFAFHRASADADLMDREALARYSLLALFFCTVSVTDETMPLLYAAGALWSVGAGPSLKWLAEPENEN